MLSARSVRGWKPSGLDFWSLAMIKAGFFIVHNKESFLKEIFLNAGINKAYLFV